MPNDFGLGVFTSFFFSFFPILHPFLKEKLRFKKY